MKFFILLQILFTISSMILLSRKNLAFLRDCDMVAFLRDCDMDIIKVEAEIQKYASKGTHISQTMKPCKALLPRLQKGRDDKRILMGLLLEMTIIFPLVLLL